MSEPKMPGTDTDGYCGADAYTIRTVAAHHAAWQAYAAGIRAAVLAEVRAVVPVAYGSNHEDTYQDGIKDGRADAYNRIRDALTTLEQQP